MQAQTHRTYCPYCGEQIELVIDCSLPEQCYIEDCFVCCRPIEITASCSIDNELVSVAVATDSE